ncbi:MAG TPA: hypothetical protein VLA98_12100, partial [Solirubrobacteraceae bacterium]|nr:hypothetical protein [Solirubrobacteraceae bacterium]
MPIMRRLALLLVMAGALMLAVGVGSAPAQAPSNDTWAGATVVSLPFSGTQDTTEATVGDDDLAAGAACGIDPGGGFIASHSVWYAFTPGADGVVTLDASGSTYPVIGAVVTGTPEGGFASASCFLSSPTS